MSQEEFERLAEMRRSGALTEAAFIEVMRRDDEFGLTVLVSAERRAILLALFVSILPVLLLWSAPGVFACRASHYAMVPALLVIRRLQAPIARWPFTLAAIGWGAFEAFLGLLLLFWIRGSWR